MVRTREDVVGLEASIIMPRHWKASATPTASRPDGGLQTAQGFRADQVCEEQVWN
jgi:hypothetical protein